MYDFRIFGKIAAKSKKCGHGHAGTISMEAQGVQNDPLGRQNNSQELQDEAQERQDGPSECPNGCPDGPWQPDLLLEVLPNANFTVPGSLWDWFWKPRGS